MPDSSNPENTDTRENAEQAERRAFNEDWLATAVGLILLVLVLTGVISNALVP